jgi:TolB-like protein/class 3 adenylate cyclase
MDAGPKPEAYRFDRFTLDLDRGALLGPDAAEIPLRPKSLTLLRLLVEHAGRAVDRDAIMAAVWPDVVVTDESITQCVRDVRKALGDEVQQLVKTVPKRGYLLAAEVVPVESTAPALRTERRLAAILAADIVGYSRLIEQDESGTLAAIKELRASPIDPLLAEHKGRIVKLMGDGAIVEFASVVDAVACAVAIQKAVADRQGNTLPERRIVFRIGINLGDVVVDGDDLLGDGVNVAARLEQLCEPGGVLVSGTAFDHLQGRLGLPLEFTGEQQVKNIARPVRAYRVRLEGVSTGRSAAWAPSRRTQRRLLTAAAALFAAVFLGGVWHLWPVEPPAGKPAIAVLPFENLGGDAATGRLAGGITEDIITDLARFRDLDVIARNSTAVYEGKPVDVRQVGKDLGVGYVLEGSIQREAEQVRVTAQLVRADTGAHLWSDQWDRQLADVFAVQTEIADMVTSRLGGHGVIAGAERDLARRKPPADLSAYDLYLLGIEHKHRQTKDSQQEAIRLLRLAVERDPQLSRAWTGLTWAYGISAGYAAAPDEASRLYGQMLDAATHAVQTDPADAEAHCALGEAVAYTGDLARARAEIEQALALNPSGSMPLFSYAGWASAFGQPEKGAEAADRLIRINPNFRATTPGGLSYAYFMVGRYEDAVRELMAKPEENLTDMYLAIKAGALAMLDRGDEAKAVVGRTLGRFVNMTIEGFVNRPEWADHERTRLVETMGKAGFPACMPAAEMAKLANPVRLPECEAQRATTATAAAKDG